MKKKKRVENEKSHLMRYVIHIPHASLEVPKEFKERLKVDEKTFQKENIMISDYQIDKFIPPNFSNIVFFDYSRLFCDVEKYLEDEKEEMSKYGMGAIYQKDSNGIDFIQLDDSYKQVVIDHYYKKHHQKLDKTVGTILRKYHTCYIIDLHSFSDEFVYKMFHKTNNPDICIGINIENYDSLWLKKTIIHFHHYGYTVRVNSPYSGSMTSNQYPNVKSMMIEVNKRIYKGKKQERKFYRCMMKYYELI